MLSVCAGRAVRGGGRGGRAGGGGRGGRAVPAWREEGGGGPLPVHRGEPGGGQGDTASQAGRTR